MHFSCNLRDSRRPGGQQLSPPASQQTANPSQHFNAFLCLKTAREFRVWVSESYSVSCVLSNIIPIPRLHFSLLNAKKLKENKTNVIISHSFNLTANCNCHSSHSLICFLCIIFWKVVNECRYIHCLKEWNRKCIIYNLRSNSNSSTFSFIHYNYNFYRSINHVHDIWVVSPYRWQVCFCFHFSSFEANFIVYKFFAPLRTFIWIYISIFQAECPTIQHRIHRFSMLWWVLILLDFNSKFHNRKKVNVSAYSTWGCDRKYVSLNDTIVL